MQKTTLKENKAEVQTSKDLEFINYKLGCTLSAIGQVVLTWLIIGSLLCGKWYFALIFVFIYLIVIFAISFCKTKHELQDDKEDP